MLSSLNGWTVLIESLNLLVLIPGVEAILLLSIRDGIVGSDGNFWGDYLGDLTKDLLGLLLGDFNSFFYSFAYFFAYSFANSLAYSLAYYFIYFATSSLCSTSLASSNFSLSSGLTY